ncbi:sugar dehydrogenase complex small subunit [Gluconobacter kondonii]|nr:sugar dehydrogenase complex small subunit [Gluconobacter kondonii]GBR36792.1 membrane bound FAD containing D-sorbitol dehydrogenase [Gluconobacter kondonii NBRC 3266]
MYNSLQSPRLGRRIILLGGGAAAMLSTLRVKAAVSSSVSNDAAFERFMDVSKRLTGMKVLDVDFGQRLYESCQRIIPNFQENANKLSQEVGQGTTPLEQALLVGWYDGVVEHGDKAECVAYVASLDRVITSDVLKPPSYAFGAYGSWKAQPRPDPSWITQDNTP